MVDPFSYLLISIVTLGFGLLVSFQIAHIFYIRKLTRLARRCVDTGTIAPILVELEKTHQL
ncbi:MAG TPA: hypothetical protein VMS89_02540 [Methanoregulaceae archaeon]|nr:hypothetical protein [Methanoregulaceae archaeon]